MLSSTRLPFFFKSVFGSAQLMALIAIIAAFYHSGGIFINCLICLATYDVIHKFLIAPIPLKNNRGWQVVIVGAGPAGLCAAKKLMDVGINDFVILEKSSGIGGTWRQNKYPGVASDIPPHYYSFSFFLNPWWSKLFVNGAEIYDYIKLLAKTFGLMKYIRFDSAVTVAHWDKREKKWHLSTTTGQEYKADIVIRATGLFHLARNPKFKNEDAFSGDIVHSLDWKPEMPLKGKRVAVIGTGASGVQIVPSIVDKVDELILFQRTPAWSPIKRNFRYSEWTKMLFYIVPWTGWLVRALQFWYYEFVHHFMLKMDSPFMDYFQKGMEDEMRDVIGDDPELVDKLIPKYTFGCKRAAASDSFLQSFKKKHVNCVTESIDAFTQNGIRTLDGQEYACDLIIKATGFDLLASMKSFPLYGTDPDQSWGDIVGKEPRSHLGVTIPGFPNFFMIFGPNSGASHVSMFFTFECQVNYIIDCLRCLERDGKSVIELKKEVYDASVAGVKWYMRNKSYASNSCTSAFMNDVGVNWTLWPRDLVSFWYNTYSCRTSEYSME